MSTRRVKEKCRGRRKRLLEVLKAEKERGSTLSSPGRVSSPGKSNFGERRRGGSLRLAREVLLALFEKEWWTKPDYSMI